MGIKLCLIHTQMHSCLLITFLAYLTNAQHTVAQLCWIYDYLYAQNNDYVLGHMGFAVFFTFI